MERLTRASYSFRHCRRHSIASYVVSVSCVCCANAACADKVRSKEGIAPSFAIDFNCYVAQRLKTPATSGCDTASSSSFTFAVNAARRSRTVFEDASCCSSSGRSPSIRSCILVYGGVSIQRLYKSDMGALWSRGWPHQALRPMTPQDLHLMS